MLRPRVSNVLVLCCLDLCSFSTGSYQSSYLSALHVIEPELLHHALLHAGRYIASELLDQLGRKPRQDAVGGPIVAIPAVEFSVHLLAQENNLEVTVDR